ncbi:NAD-dependent deacylase [Capnocytophaga canis]|uniref:NAD-dependent deacylase n=1 Tax=Capnocytophaga canis TaxID=1848903 RepID=UPI001562B485
MMKKKIVVLTGAGISEESGIRTFRDANGLWEGHDVMEVASPEGFSKNPSLVLEFYNQRRRQLKEVKPNKAHQLLVQLENEYDVVIITQNVDDLHERAGSSNVIHLHGELLKSRGVDNDAEIFDCQDDILLGDLSPSGVQLRPHIVWFGEDVPLITKAIEQVETADIFLIVGTSLQVYPSAGLIHYTQPKTPVYYVDPFPQIQSNKQLTVIAQKASSGVQKAIETIKSHII